MVIAEIASKELVRQRRFSGDTRHGRRDRGSDLLLGVESFEDIISPALERITDGRHYISARPSLASEIPKAAFLRIHKLMVRSCLNPIDRRGLVL